MGVPVGGLSSVEQPLHSGAVGRQRPDARLLADAL